MIHRCYGKLAPRRRATDLHFMDVLPATLPTPPREWDVDMNNNLKVAEGVFANDKVGCCVVAMRANATLRMEGWQQDKVISISDDEVLKEYYTEQGDPQEKAKPDEGLVATASLDEWRTTGWMVGGQNYKIDAWAAVSRHDHLQVMVACWLLGGGGTDGQIGGAIAVGMEVSNVAMKQVDNSEIWDVVDNDEGMDGGHEVYLVGYTLMGPVVITWGQRQQMTWAFWDRYVDELQAVVNAKDLFINSPLNVDEMMSYIKLVSN